MKVSVALTLYNGEEYLIEQLESINNQSLKVDEVIIFDDCSTDTSYALTEEFIKKNNLSDCWFLNRQESNVGYANNFFRAIDSTTGDIVLFSDQDDIWIEDRVESIYELFDRNDDIKVMGSEFSSFKSSPDAPSIPRSTLRKMTNDGSLENITLKSSTIFIGSEGCTMCIRKNFFNDIKRYWFDGWAHDEFVWKMSLCYGGLYVYHKETLHRRLHSNNVSKRKMRDISKRVDFLKKLKLSHIAMLQFAKDLCKDEIYIDLINKNILSVELRIELLLEKKYLNVIELVFRYSKYYHSKKSIPVELYMALR